jgi:hypothetical protein
MEMILQELDCVAPVKIARREQEIISTIVE